MGLAADVSILGSAFNGFLSTECVPTDQAYPFYDNLTSYHTWRDLGFNLFRLPVAWQHAQESLSGPLNSTNMAYLDSMIKNITNDGNTAILDIHNYARWYCAVINQPASSYPKPLHNVSDDDFVDLWTKLATRYASHPQLVFELMNEPHDLNMTMWASTVQKAITAIRATGANNSILVPGTGFARLRDWVDFSSEYIGPGKLHDPQNNLIYDFHQYFDDDGGSYGLCHPWSAFRPAFVEVTEILRNGGARGMLTEFGGLPSVQCVEMFQGLLTFLNENSDVWEGWTAWGDFNPGDLYLSTNKSDPFYTLTRVLEAFAPNR